MYRIFIMLFCLYSSTVLGQKTKKIKELKSNSELEIYYVLKSSPEIKQGKYALYNKEGRTKIEGFYRNNLKDSIWTEYYADEKLIKSQGNFVEGKKDGFWIEYYLKYDKHSLKSKGSYDMNYRTGEWIYYYAWESSNYIESKGIFVDDKKSGIWEYYNDYEEGNPAKWKGELDGNNNKIGIWEYYSSKGDFYQKYDYSKNEVLDYSFDSTKLYKVKTDTGIIETTLDSPPMYVGSIMEANAALSKTKPNLRYPEEAKENGIYGRVEIQFFIDINGKAIDHRILNGIGFGCDEEALRVVKMIPNNWISATLNGEKVVAEYVYGISFWMN